MISQIQIPGLVSSLLFSGVVAWGVIMPLFRKYAVESGDADSFSPALFPANTAAAAALDRCLEAIVALELEYRSGSVDPADYSERLSRLRRQAVELRWRVQGGGIGE